MQENAIKPQGSLTKKFEFCDIASEVSADECN
jgi:hypothetical protein